MIKQLLSLFLCALMGCQPDADADLVPDEYQCQAIAIQQTVSRNELLNLFEEDILQGAASIDIPDNAGAMGRNKNGYFHVRFQMGIAAHADYAVYSQSIQSLAYAIKAMEYAFEYQLADGNFELIIPSDLSGEELKEGDVASGVSFFLSSVGLAVNTLEQSSWYHAASNSVYKSRVEYLRPQIEKAANWLLTKKEVLKTADQHAPNRLLFNALSFYSLGLWLNKTDLKSAGISFVHLAMAQKHPTGYFIEAEGWDSSYQGVAINVGFNLYSLLPAAETLKVDLWNSLSCAADWQKSRVLENGEISLEGNTRVYRGGEAFLGTEKQIDWIDTMMGFFMMGYYAESAVYEVKAKAIKDYYYP